MPPASFVPNQRDLLDWPAPEPWVEWAAAPAGGRRCATLDRIRAQGEQSPALPVRFHWRRPALPKKRSPNMSLTAHAWTSAMVAPGMATAARTSRWRTPARTPPAAACPDRRHPADAPESVRRSSSAHQRVFGIPPKATGAGRKVGVDPAVRRRRLYRGLVELDLARAAVQGVPVQPALIVLLGAHDERVLAVRGGAAELVLESRAVRGDIPFFGRRLLDQKGKPATQLIRQDVELACIGGCGTDTVGGVVPGLSQVLQQANPVHRSARHDADFRPRLRMGADTGVVWIGGIGSEHRVSREVLPAIVGRQPRRSCFTSEQFEPAASHRHAKIEREILVVGSQRNRARLHAGSRAARPDPPARLVRDPPGTDRSSRDRRRRAPAPAIRRRPLETLPSATAEPGTRARRAPRPAVHDRSRGSAGVPPAGSSG